MKNKLQKFLVAILFCAALTSQAQTNGENGTSNAAAAVVPTANNAPPSLTIDDSGMHVGAPAPANVDFFPPEKLALLIPIIAIIMGCSIPIIIVGFQLYFRHRKNQTLHETVRAMVDKGVAIPPEMFQKTERDAMAHDKSEARLPRKDLRNGLLLIGIGLGAIIVAGKPGWIVFFMGVAFLVVSFFEKKDNNDVQPPKP